MCGFQAILHAALPLCHTYHACCYIFLQSMQQAQPKLDKHARVQAELRARPSLHQLTPNRNVALQQW